MLNEIVVTIGFPVYNVGNYIEKSLLSALNQDFEYPFEILVVDDCGTDDSMSVVEKLSKDHPKGNYIRVVKHPYNKGLGEARNTIIREAVGTYLFFLDSDDWISNDCISNMFTKAETHHADYVVGSFDTYCNGKIIDGLRLRDYFACGDGAAMNMKLNGYDWQVAVWNKLYNLDFLRSNSIGCIHSTSEDVIFDYKVRICSKSVVCISNITYNYLARESSITDNYIKNPSDEIIEIYSDIVLKMKDIAKDNSELKGIWDYYFLSLRFIFIAVSKKNFSPKQISAFQKKTSYYLKSIPSVKCLYSSTHKILLLLGYLGLDFKQFLYVYSVIEKTRSILKK